jgi:hypothetical protein
MFKDILKRKDLPKSKKGRRRQTAEKDREKDEFGGMRISGDVEALIGTKEQRDKRDKREADAKKAGFVNPFKITADLSQSTDVFDKNFNDFAIFDEMKKRVEGLFKEAKFYFNKGEERHKKLDTEFKEALKRKQGIARVRKTIESANYFGLKKFNEKLKSENMKIGKNNYPVIEVLAAIVLNTINNDDTEATVRETFTDAAEFLEKTNFQMLTEEANGYKFLADLAEELGISYLDRQKNGMVMVVGRTGKFYLEEGQATYFDLDRVLD